MIGAATWHQHQGTIQAFAPSSQRLNYQQEQQRRRKERPPNSGSKLLTRPENELMFEVLGCDRVSLAAGVIQLLKSVKEQWQHQHVGVVSLIKDYQRKLYALTLFDIYNGNQLWEQVLYRGFRATTYQQCPKFLTFEGDGSVFGLNFSDDEEAHDFKCHLEKRYEQEQKSNQKGPNGSIKGPPSRPQPPNKPPAAGITDVGSMPHFGIYQHNSPVDSKKAKSKDKKNKKKPRIRKEDIGHPTNFQHKAHLGWDVDGGFSQNFCEGEPLDESVKELLRAAGQNPEDMKPDDIAFVRTFINNYQEAPGNSHPPPSLPSVQSSPAVVQPMSNTHSYPSNAIHPVQSTPITYNRPAAPPRPPAADYYGGHQQEYGSYNAGGHGGNYNSYSQQAAPPTPPSQPPPAPMRDASIQHNRPIRPPPIEARTTSYSNGPQSAPPPPPPMPPVSQNTTSRPQPPPPAPPPPPSTQSSTSSIPPPPPPPPPPGMLSTNNNKVSPPSAPKPTPPKAPAPDGRSDLLQAIQKGAKLKHVDPPAERTPLAATANPRDNMMEQIRQGAQLKHVDQQEVETNRKSVPGSQQMGGIAGALARALEERRKNMNNSDDSEAENDSEWEDD